MVRFLEIIPDNFCCFLLLFCFVLFVVLGPEY